LVRDFVLELDHHVFEALYKYTKSLFIALGHRDTFTRSHSEKVTDLSKEVGIACQLSSEEINGLMIAANHEAAC